MNDEHDVGPQKIAKQLVFQLCDRNNILFPFLLDLHVQFYVVTFIRENVCSLCDFNK